LFNAFVFSKADHILPRGLITDGGLDHAFNTSVLKWFFDFLKLGFGFVDVFFFQGGTLFQRGHDMNFGVKCLGMLQGKVQGIFRGF